MTLPEASTGITSESLADLSGGGGGDTPPIFSAPRFDSLEAMNSFSSATLSDAAGTVKQTLSNAATSVATAATNLYNTVTGKGNAVAVPVLNVQASTTPATGSSMTWVYVLLAALAGYAAYTFAKGKGKGKFFTSKGSAVKFRGK